MKNNINKFVKNNLTITINLIKDKEKTLTKYYKNNDS